MSATLPSGPVLSPAATSAEGPPPAAAFSPAVGKAALPASAMAHPGAAYPASALVASGAAIPPSQPPAAAAREQPRAQAPQMMGYGASSPPPSQQPGVPSSAVPGVSASPLPAVAGVPGYAPPQSHAVAPANLAPAPLAATPAPLQVPGRAASTPIAAGSAPAAAAVPPTPTAAPPTAAPPTSSAPFGGKTEKAPLSFAVAPPSPSANPPRPTRGFDLFFSKTLELMAQRGQQVGAGPVDHEVVVQIRHNWENLPEQHRRDFEELANKLPALQDNPAKLNGAPGLPVDPSVTTQNPAPATWPSVKPPITPVALPTAPSVPGMQPTYGAPMAAAAPGAPMAAPVSNGSAGPMRMGMAYQPAPGMPAPQPQPPIANPAMAVPPDASRQQPAMPTWAAGNGKPMAYSSAGFTPPLISAPNSYMVPPYWNYSAPPMAQSPYMLPGWQGAPGQPMAGAPGAYAAGQPMQAMPPQATAPQLKAPAQQGPVVARPQSGRKHSEGKVRAPAARSKGDNSSNGGGKSVTYVLKKSSRTFATVINQETRQRSNHLVTKRGLRDFVAGLKLPKHTPVEIIRCICKQHVEDGAMVRCDTCEAWQHCLCMNVEPNSPEKYQCELCLPREVQKEVKLVSKPDAEGNLHYKTLLQDEQLYSLGQCVYVDCKDVPWDILRIEELYVNAGGQRMMRGHLICRPPEVTGARRFFKNEVFDTKYFRDFRLSEAKGVCCVMDVESWRQGRPTGFRKKDVYVCEQIYNHKRKAVSIIKTWRWGSATACFEFSFFPTPSTEKRNYNAQQSIETDDSAPMLSASEDSYFCPIETCQKKYASISGLRKHFHSKHPGITFSAVTHRTEAGKTGPEDTTFHLQHKDADGESSDEEPPQPPPKSNGRARAKRRAPEPAAMPTRRERRRTSGHAAHSSAAGYSSGSDVEDLRPSRSKRRNPFGKFVHDVPPLSASEYPTAGTTESMQIAQVLPKHRGFIVRCQFGSTVYTGFCVPHAESAVNGNPRNRFSRKQKERTGATDSFRNLECTDCPQTFETDTRLSLHQRMDHSSDSADTKRRAAVAPPPAAAPQQPPPQVVPPPQMVPSPQQLPPPPQQQQQASPYQQGGMPAPYVPGQPGPTNWLGAQFGASPFLGAAPPHHLMSYPPSGGMGVYAMPNQ